MAEEDDDSDSTLQDLRPTGGAIPHLVYRRGDKVATRRSPKASKLAHHDVYAHACVGKLEVGGQKFDTFERMDNFVALRASTSLVGGGQGGPRRYYRCQMEFSSKKFYPPDSSTPRKQIRPLNHGVKKKGGGLAAILIHPGDYPSSFIGCIGVGKFDGKDKLNDSGKCMEKILELCGGFKEGKLVYLTVIGEKPPTPAGPG
jgi:hypothetical protein